jgi:3-isopropylmalate/(R)-2-methylmalate dehydratase small subunit
MPDDHVDTDRIIPARFLSRIERAGYGELLFADVRNEDFILNSETAKGASILVVGENFGCGSSREHAVWAIQQAGFRVVIAKRSGSVPGFSDIFRQNSANNGLLLIDLDEADHAKIAALGTGALITVDLEQNRIEFDGTSVSFQVDPSNRQAILEGRDLIGTTLLLEPQITSYEQSARNFTPSCG